MSEASVIKVLARPYMGDEPGYSAELVVYEQGGGTMHIIPLKPESAATIGMELTGRAVSHLMRRRHEGG